MENLAEAAKITLQLLVAEKQVVILCDAREHTTGYILLTKEYTDTDEGFHRFYAPVAFCSRQITTNQMSLTMYASEFLAFRFAFDKFGHISRVVRKPTIVMANNKALFRFFEAKQTPPILRNFATKFFSLFSKLLSRELKIRGRLFVTIGH